MRSGWILLVYALAGSLPAQTVDAPSAQALVEAALRKHPEMQTMGIHTRLPGQTQNTNIACSKPWKVGKVSAPIEMEVLRTGKPYLRHTELGAIDMGLTLADRAGGPVGMVVIVLRKNFTQDDQTALARATVIRDELAAHIADKATLLAGARISHGPLYLIAQVPLSGLDKTPDALAIEHARVFLRAGDRVERFTLEGDPVNEPGMPAHWRNDAAGVAGTDHAAGIRIRSDDSGLTLERVRAGRWAADTTIPDRGATVVAWDPRSERLYAAYPAHDGEEGGLLVYRVFR